MAYRKPKSLDASAELFILNGVLRGVSIPMTRDRTRLGSTSDCDVMLIDETGDAGEIVITPADDGDISLEAVAGSIRVGRRSLKVGLTRTASKEVLITVGNVQMALGSTFARADRSRGSYKRQAIGAVWAASLAVGLGLLGFWGLSSGSGSVVAKPSPISERAYILDQSGRSRSTAAAQELRARLDEAGFRSLDIFTDEKERMLTVKGKLRDSDEPRWLKIFEWFDRSYGESIYLDAKFDLIDSEITLPFMIEAVWAGRDPRVTLDDGSKRFIGDELPGGWRLNSVTPISVTITKGDETLFVKL